MEVDGEAPKKGLKILNEEKPDVKKAQENGHEELKGWVHRNAKKGADLYNICCIVTIFRYFFSAIFYGQFFIGYFSLQEFFRFALSKNVGIMKIITT